MDYSRLGKRIGDYPAGSVGATLTQLFRRLALASVVALIILGVMSDEGIDLTRTGVASIVLGSLFGLHLAWRAVTARFGIRRIFLHENGVYATNLFGQQADAVTWDEVTGLREISGQSLVSNFYRLELHRHGSAPMALITIGFKRTLIEAVLHQMQNAGSPSR
ncbi:hypothetical protein [Actinoplanes palleronii]|uniref:PH domain-containing protein n=1 Tax=Actinoplanes palleronii TaxID=113570 RepID=A0ABQ4BQD9_9ACTN|nr:hypothetical protein [Actinoplanes palleronii]GIE72872.1 hypothetical protein Apa02nite_089800 [Actinoplanes palleronii]